MKLIAMMYKIETNEIKDYEVREHEYIKLEQEKSCTTQQYKQSTGHVLSMRYSLTKKKDIIEKKI